MKLWSKTQTVINKYDRPTDNLRTRMQHGCNTATDTNHHSRQYPGWAKPLQNKYRQTPSLAHSITRARCRKTPSREQDKRPSTRWRSRITLGRVRRRAAKTYAANTRRQLFKIKRCPPRRRWLGTTGWISKGSSRNNQTGTSSKDGGPPPKTG